MRALSGFLFVASCGLLSSLAAASSTAIEYFHAGFGHYFVTASPPEIAGLDAGTPPGWSRTGESFGVPALNTPGSSNVCRFWSGQTFAPQSSHFYTPFASECALVKGDPDWLFENEAFAMPLPDAAGTCGGGMVPLYRLYNNGQSGAPNHRYTTRPSIRSAMLAQGWIAEGSGIGVIGCAPSATPVTIVAAGDIAQCFNTPAATSAAAKTAALVTPQDALALTLGDNTYDYGRPEEFTDCFHPTWGAFKDRIRPAIGNHEYGTPGADGYFGYFGAQAGSDRSGYYSFDFGGWHFISLNSMIDTSPQSEQYLWLAADLANSRDTLCTIAYWHYPMYSSGVRHGSYPKMAKFFEALHAAGVDIVLSGDEHFYERFAPQNAAGTLDRARGIRQFVVGTGGAGLYAMGSPLPNSEVRDNSTHGVLRLTLEQGSYSWQFMPVGGGPARDTGVDGCHR